MTEQDRSEGLYHRQTLFDQARRVVIKVGSAVLTGPDGLDHEVLEGLCREIRFLRETGRQVILVSSGAVAAGRRRLGVAARPGEPLRVKQALAATGQGLLMQAYEQILGRMGVTVAQVLLTHADLAHRGRYLNIRNTFNTLLDFGAVPIVNENDTVSVEELRFGDNDRLGALLCNMLEADMYLILTDVDGLYPRDPGRYPDQEPIYTVREIDEQVEAMVGHTTSAMGTGGMRSKLEAVRMVAAGGASAFIGPGRRRAILEALFSGEPVGTFFLPSKKALSGRKQWIAHVLRPEGELRLDDGAARAIVHEGRSLLPSGIVSVRGRFGVGAPVRCLDRQGRFLGVGLSNYDADAVDRIKGLHSGRILEVLGYKDSDEVIHRDNFVPAGRLGNASAARSLEATNPQTTRRRR